MMDVLIIIWATVAALAFVAAVIWGGVNGDGRWKETAAMSPLLLAGALTWPLMLIYAALCHWEARR